VGNEDLMSQNDKVTAEVSSARLTIRWTN